MDRAYASGAAGAPPSAPAIPSAGYPTAGNAGTGTPATKPGAYWYHMIMEELMAVIVAAGVAPAAGTLTQLKQALDMIYGSKIQPISASVAANALTLTLNPTGLSFRSSPVSSGAVNNRFVGNALSLVVPSGATLGTVSGQAARLMLLAIDNAGVVELAVVNLAGGTNLDETTLISTTAISAASTAENVVYSTDGRANVPFRVVGFIDILETTAGIWGAAPTTIQGQGGQALGALSSIGYGQSWQNLTGSRSAGVTYYNTTGRPIQIDVSGSMNATGVVINLSINGVSVTGDAAYTAGAVSHVSAIIPPGASYNANGNGGSISSINNWSELR